MRRFAFSLIAIAAMAVVFAPHASPQGETTSAIAGQVADPSGAALSGAIVRLKGVGNGIERTVRTADSGRFSFAQLKPGTYAVEAYAPGFERQRKPSIVAAVGQTQTIDFVLPLSAAIENVVVTTDAPLINTENANTATTLGSESIANLPNPGSDLTYPVQFAPGALINTAGSSNDFVGAQNGYGNVQFNGLPALSNAYIVDGLETNDPLTNLNSGLSTNLVLGLNSISEVTVNTTSYAVDQGRYGASQITYITKSGTNVFHGNLYEVWNGSKLNAADFFTNATPGNQKPRSTVNHFGGSLGGPVRRNRLFLFTDFEQLRIALPIVTPVTVPSAPFAGCVARGMAGPAPPTRRSRNWFRSIATCFRCMAAPAERRWPCWAVPSIQTGLRPPVRLPMEMVAPCGAAFRSRAAITNRWSPRAWTTISTRPTPRGIASNRIPACKPPIPTRSIRCSTPFPRSRSTPSRPATRTSSMRNW